MDNEQSNKNSELLTVGITGLILGVAGTAALALSDKEMRKRANHKAQEVLALFQQWSKKTFQEFQEKKETLQETMQDDINKIPTLQ